MDRKGLTHMQVVQHRHAAAVTVVSSALLLVSIVHFLMSYETVGHRSEDNRWALVVLLYTTVIVSAISVVESMAEEYGYFNFDMSWLKEKRTSLYMSQGVVYLAFFSDVVFMGGDLWAGFLYVLISAMCAAVAIADVWVRYVLPRRLPDK